VAALKWHEGRVLGVFIRLTSLLLGLICELVCELSRKKPPQIEVAFIIGIIKL
jgi:hypothetical protein